MKTQTQEIQGAQSPDQVLEMLKTGNQRFVQNRIANRDHLNQVVETSSGQFPHSVVLSCIDSRVPVEIIFDQGIGDIFSTRVAGNIVNEDVLGSIEYSCKVAGSMIVLVLGHTKCGAVTSACKGVELGNITALLSKITPSVKEVMGEQTELSSELIEEVSKRNVEASIDQIRKQSPILAEMEQSGSIQIKGAMYDVSSGVVEYY